MLQPVRFLCRLFFSIIAAAFYHYVSPPLLHMPLRHYCYVAFAYCCQYEVTLASLLLILRHFDIFSQRHYYDTLVLHYFISTIFTAPLRH